MSQKDNQGRKAAVEELFQGGETVPTISEELGLSERCIRNILCTKDRLEELYHEEGFTQREIGSLMGISQPAIARRMDQQGVRTRNPPDWTTKEEMFLKNNYREISREELESALPERSWEAIKLKAMKIGVAQSKEERMHSEEVKQQLYSNSQENMIKIDFEKSDSLSYILGVVDGDGFHDKQGTVGLEATSRKFVEKFTSSLEKVGMNPGRGKRRGNRETVWGSSRQLVRWLMSMDHDSKLGWLTHDGSGWNYIEGRYESDGNITENGTARICSYDKKSKQFISRLLNCLDVDCTIQQNNVYVLKSNADKFFENIDPVIRQRGSNS